MRRVTVDEVIAAYNQTGLKPKQRNYFWNDGCACAFGVLYIANRGSIEDERKGYFADKYADDLTGSTDYTNGFIAGFDGDELENEEYDKEFLAGFEDGTATWNAVKGIQ